MSTSCHVPSVVCGGEEQGSAAISRRAVPVDLQIGKNWSEEPMGTPVLEDWLYE
jgi:hypothetical protein